MLFAEKKIFHPLFCLQKGRPSAENREVGVSKYACDINANALAGLLTRSFPLSADRPPSLRLRRKEGKKDFKIISGFQIPPIHPTINTISNNIFNVIASSLPLFIWLLLRKEIG
jgi:hypothetical protein